MSQTCVTHRAHHTGSTFCLRIPSLNVCSPVCCELSNLDANLDEGVTLRPEAQQRRREFRLSLRCGLELRTQQPAS